MGSGRGRVRVIEGEGRTLVLIDGATTQTRTLKRFVAAHMAKAGRHLRPVYGPFEVRIWTSLREDRKGAHDVDNVAKAILDALDGHFWHDDRQVMRLVSERFRGDANRIAVRITPLEKEPFAELDATLLSDRQDDTASGDVSQ